MGCALTRKRGGGTRFGMALTAAVVDEAITKVLGGQSYTLPDGTVVTRPNLQVLIELRSRLQAEEAASSSGNGLFRPVQFGRIT